MSETPGPTFQDQQSFTSQDPSLTAGNTAATLEKMSSVMNDVLPMFDLPDDMLKEASRAYIDERISKLAGDTTSDTIGPLTGGTDEFIGSSAPLFKNGLHTETYLDDKTAYEVAFPYIKSFYMKFIAEGMSSDRAYLNAVIQGSNISQAVYFESYYGDPIKNEALSGDILYDPEDAPGPEHSSIAKYKGSAMCLERAAVTHNVLKIFGATSHLEIGNLSSRTTSGEISEEAHAFLTIENSEGKLFIFDPTNPVAIVDESGGIISMQAALYPIEDRVNDYNGVLVTKALKDGSVQSNKKADVTYTFKLPESKSIHRAPNAVTSTS